MEAMRFTFIVSGEGEIPAEAGFYNKAKQQVGRIVSIKAMPNGEREVEVDMEDQEAIKYYLNLYGNTAMPYFSMAKWGEQ